MNNRALFESGALSHDMLAGIEAQRRIGASGGANDRLALSLFDEMTMGKFAITPALRYERSKIESKNALVESRALLKKMGGFRPGL